MNRKPATRRNRQIIRPSSSDGNRSSSDLSSLSPQASGSDVWDHEKRGSKKRKSDSGEAYSHCIECPEKDEKIRELTKSLENIRLGNEHKRQASELESMTAMYHDMKRKYEAEREAKENAILRLSKLTSSRLRDNNPNIADLSDEYRPTKLAEIYSEMYDNEWTDAYEGLDGIELSEEDIIRFLLELIMIVYKKCKTLAESQLQTLVKMIVAPFSSENINDVPEEIKDVIKGIKDYRKSHARETINVVQKHIEDSREVKYLDIDQVNIYFKACVKLCWLAVHQDPPLVLDVEQNSSSTFDSKRFQEYTKTGPYVGFVVWPALLLHENGSLLRKGVAQGAQSAGRLCELS
ncbi:hypothetical protein ACF0H5_005035 [Mactra antiquata]